jgi:glycosyltransferase involved in cell wall biosynthesis
MVNPSADLSSLPAPLHPRPRVLVFAYACEPDAGSEPGAGWGLVRALGSFADCVVLVGAEHAAAIHRWQQTHGSNRVRFVEVREGRFWRHDQRLHRLTRFVMYLFWLRRARGVGQRLHAAFNFDATYHATYSTYWLPTPAVDYGVPCIWGPVGGAVTTPRTLWRLLGWRGLLTEGLDYASVRLLSSLPATTRSCRHAAVRIVQNEATQRRLPRDVRGATLVLNHALFADVPESPAVPRGRRCVFVGALESRKGARLAVLALQHASEAVHLDVVGDGPERVALQTLATRLKVSHRIRFRGRAAREQVGGWLRSAAAAVFTGLREEGGLALAEAMCLGTPVVVLAHGGAGTIARAATDPTRVSLIPPGDIATTARRIGEAMTHFTHQTPEHDAPLLDRQAATCLLRDAVEEVCRDARTRQH